LLEPETFLSHGEQKMKSFVAGLVGVAMVGVASVASAQTMYVTGKVGPYLPDASALDDGISIEAAIGRGFTEMFPGARGSWLQNVSLEAGLGFYTADGSVTFAGQRVEAELWVVPATVMGIYTYQVPGTKLDLHGGAGLGLYFSSVEERVTALGIDEDDTNIDLGLRLVAGAYYNINPRFALGGELRFDFVSDDVGGVFPAFGAKYRF
jgi:hypothetical protein